MSTKYQLLISILTIIMSGGVASIVTYLLATKREEKLFRRKKIEELYLGIKKYCDAFFLNIVHFIPIFNGYDSSSIKNEDAEEKEYDHHEIEMLIFIYFPRLQPAWDEIDKVKGEFSAVFRKYTANCKDGKRFHKELLPALNKCIDMLKAAKENMIKSILKEAKSTRM